MSGRTVRLKSVPIQSLSELERARLQEVAFYRLQQDFDLGCQITIPKGTTNRALAAFFAFHRKYAMKSHRWTVVSDD
ncbi:unnamed protein product [Ranitomeya imitator]|uniref:Uncharacterized protein n=1 Tax=Ranitomeya imitator TaxID=111125 RepID=A0ABN9LBA2_9NEOB|nr:unnamed protein product [Ranitomeya imitator]